MNWRTKIADRYRDSPRDERVGRVLLGLPEDTQDKIVVLFDYKGSLQVIWREVTTAREKEFVNIAWNRENEEIVDHYVLNRVGPESGDRWLW